MVTTEKPVKRAAPRARHWGRSRVALTIIAAVLVVLIGVRIALPFVVRESINRRLAKVPDYGGQVAGVDIHLYRSAYSLRGVEIVKRNGQVKEPFFSAKDIDFGLAWRELFRGKIVADIVIDQASLNFVKGATAENSQLAADKRWQEVVHDIFPIDITFLKISDSQLRFVDNSRTPRVDLKLERVTVVATGLRNRPADDGETYPARVAIEGGTIGGGKLKLVTNAEPLAAQPNFFLKLQVEGVSMPALNDMLQAYLGIYVSDGLFKGYVELAVREGRYKGYFKPFFEHVEFKEMPDQKQSLGQEIRQTLASLIAAIFRNRSRDNVATRIPFEGDVDKVSYGTWQTLLRMFLHGFVSPLPEKLDSAVKANSGEIANPIPAKGEETSTKPVPAKAEEKPKS